LVLSCLRPSKLHLLLSLD